MLVDNILDALTSPRAPAAAPAVFKKLRLVICVDVLERLPIFPPCGRLAVADYAAKIFNFILKYYIFIIV